MDTDDKNVRETRVNEWIAKVQEKYLAEHPDMTALDADDDWDEILKTIDASPYSRLPVYQNSVDNIIGVLYLNHFLKALVDRDKVDIKTLLMQPCYVYKTMVREDFERTKCRQHDCGAR